MLIRATEDHQQRVAIPHEQGEWMALRRLTWSQWERAEQIAFSAQAHQLADMGEDIARLLIGGQRERGAKKAENPLEKYDKRAVLQFGIAAWSYDEEVSPDSIGMLDPITVEWAHREILRVNGMGEAEPAPTPEPASLRIIAGSTGN